MDISNQIWSREHPIAPIHPPSYWYWAWFDGSNEPLVAEIWPSRKAWPRAWWGPRVFPPSSQPDGDQDNATKDETEVEAELQTDNDTSTTQIRRRRRSRKC